MIDAFTQHSKTDTVLITNPLYCIIESSGMDV